jgi:hypothetical protein
VNWWAFPSIRAAESAGIINDRPNPGAAAPCRISKNAGRTTTRNAFSSLFQQLEKTCDFRSTTSAVQTAVGAESYFSVWEGSAAHHEKQPRPKNKNNKSQTATMGQSK